MRLSGIRPRSKYSILNTKYQNKEFFDILEEKRHKRRQQREKCLGMDPESNLPLCKRGGSVKKVNKGTRGMSRLSEAMKDVISCDKPRGSANATRSVDLRMGQPGMLKTCHQKKRTRRTETSK